MSKVDIPIPNIYAHPSLATVTTLPNIASFCLPCSRGIGELTPVTKRQIQQLSFPMRIWVVNNSGSMQRTDGHRLVKTGKIPHNFKVQFGIAEGSLDKNVLREEMDHAIGVMNSVQPRGITPLIKHIENIKQNMLEMQLELLEVGCRVTIIIAMDGLTMDERGYGGAAIQQRFVELLRGLEGLPVWVVIRLCTDKKKVVDFYNNLDGQLELSLDVLDDFVEEAREAQSQVELCRFFDLFDERRLSLDELEEFCSVLLLDNSASVEPPDPKIDWEQFSRAVKALLGNQQGQWNPLWGRVRTWIDVKRMDKIYRKKRWSFASTKKRFLR
ncbi:LOW QUALITY PROTEIN: hypothetical protein ACHAXA_002881 [Cyclostephanos tholiformis]|uniref:Uncharacterized protein n=1 Tax=Cyclostephanos tholiformis TaxID=382380 RepID=A0ABD3SGQ5_9STRA